MLSYIRNHPLLFAGFAIPVLLGIVVFITAYGASVRNSTATGYYGMIADTHRDRPDLEPFKQNDLDQSGKRLFGVTETEGMALIEACSRSTWVLLGLQGYSERECPTNELARCDIGDKYLVAKRDVWMGSRSVEFTACKTCLCPDFAVDVATRDPPADCETPFKFHAKLRDTKP